MKYTEEEVDYLIKFYPSEDRPTILKNLNGHSWVSIKEKAKKLKISRPNIRTLKLKILLENNLINAYWWGLIMSDGHITNKGDLIIRLQKSDSEYLKIFSEYIECNLNFGKLVSVSVMDKINGVKLKNKLQIKERKTYNPPENFDFLTTKEERLAFLLGFIDGDGSIAYRKEAFKSIRIIIHGSWLEVFEIFMKEFEDDFNLKFTVNSNKRFNTCIYIGKKENFEFLKNFAIENKLPIMGRKWNKFNK